MAHLHDAHLREAVAAERQSRLASPASSEASQKNSRPTTPCAEWDLGAGICLVREFNIRPATGPSQMPFTRTDSKKPTLRVNERDLRRCEGDPALLKRCGLAMLKGESIEDVFGGDEHPSEQTPVSSRKVPGTRLSTSIPFLARRRSTPNITSTLAEFKVERTSSLRHSSKPPMPPDVAPAPETQRPAPPEKQGSALLQRRLADKRLRRLQSSPTL